MKDPFHAPRYQFRFDKARCSVPNTDPFRYHDVLLKDDAMDIGPANCVAHLFWKHADATAVLVSVSHIYGGNPILDTPLVCVSHVCPNPCFGDNVETSSLMVRRRTKSLMRSSIDKEPLQYGNDREISS